jgi:hypothetical protein
MNEDAPARFVTVCNGVFGYKHQRYAVCTSLRHLPEIRMLFSLDCRNCFDYVLLQTIKILAFAGSNDVRNVS